MRSNLLHRIYAVRLFLNIPSDLLNKNLTEIPAGKGTSRAETLSHRPFGQTSTGRNTVKVRYHRIITGGTLGLLLGALLPGSGADAQGLVEKTIAHTARTVTSLFMNDNGWVVWTTGLTPGSQVYLWNRSTIATLGMTNGNNRDTRINNNNWVVWDGYRSASSSSTDIFAWKNGGTYTDLSSALPSAGNAALNDSNDIIWWASGTGGNSGIYDIYYLAHTATQPANLTIFDNTGASNYPNINNSNQITWVRSVEDSSGNGVSNLVAATTAAPDSFTTVTNSSDLNVYQALKGINSSGTLVWRQYNDAKLKWDVLKSANGAVTRLSDSLTASSYEPCIANSGVVIWHSDTPTASRLYWDRNLGLGPEPLALSQPGLFNRPVVLNNNGAVVYASGNGSGTGFDIILAEPPAPNFVSGTITLPDIPGARIPFVFTFRPTNGSAPFSETVTLDSAGHFSLSNIPRQAYTLHIKGANFLAKNLLIDTTNGDVTGQVATLYGGDADGNNVVDIGDFGVLVNAYNGDKSIAGSGYDARADFNYDGVVDIADFGTLVNNYNLTGDP